MLVKIEVYHDGEFWCARGLGEDIFTQGKSLDELMDNIEEATSLHLEEILETGEGLAYTHSFRDKGKKVARSLPQASGYQIVRLLTSLGYEGIRQRGSHIRMRKEGEVGQHSITVPVHRTVALGTLNDIINRVSLWRQCT